MAELQIDLNMSFEFDKITESGESLQPLSGPRCVSLTSSALLPRLFGMHCFCKTTHRSRPNVLLHVKSVKVLKWCHIGSWA